MKKQLILIAIWHLFFANIFLLVFEMTCTFAMMDPKLHWVAITGWCLFPLTIYIQAPLTKLFNNTIFNLKPHNHV